MTSGNKLFGKRIKELRERKKYTQEQLAEIIGSDYQTISRIETGYYFTSYDKLEKIAQALDVSLQDLFNFNHFKPKEKLLDAIYKELNNLKYKDVQKVYSFIFEYLK